MEPQSVILGGRLEGEEKEDQITGMYLVFGILLCISLIGMPVGILLIICGMYRQSKKRKEENSEKERQRRLSLEYKPLNH